MKGCSFGSCTVIIDGTNSGAITVPADYDCTVTITGTNSGAITGARCVQRGVAVQAPSKESSSGPCTEEYSDYGCEVDRATLMANEIRDTFRALADGEPLDELP
ncbi:hypothetical protein FOCC_FOCC003248, partial [Frankliniella occidentalis]